MVMITLYPHILRCTKYTPSNVVDGVPVEGAATEIVLGCRYRPNTSAKSVKSADGQTVIYRGTCYLPNRSLLITTGDILSVDGQIDTATVLQVYKAQLRTRIILQ